MRLRKTLLAGFVLAVTMVLVLTACDLTIIWGGPEPEPEPDPLFTFSLEWTEDAGISPHLYLTYPAPTDFDTTDTLGTPTFVEPYLAPADGGDVGFDPNDILEGYPVEGVDERGTVFYLNRDSSTSILGDPAVEMTNVDDASETIVMRGFPFTSDSTDVSTTGGGLTGLDSGGSYTWVGVMEVYAYATSGQLEYVEGDGVNAILNVFRYGELFASYELPANTDLKGSSIVRINCFYEGNTELYQFVPDIRVIQSTTQIRSVAPGGSVGANGVITFRNPTGE